MSFKESRKISKFKFRQKHFIRDVQGIRNHWGGLASQSEISDRSGVSQATLSRIVNGKIPKIPDFVALCEVMQLSPGFYFDRVEPPFQGAENE